MTALIFVPFVLFLVAIVISIVLVRNRIVAKQMTQELVIRDYQARRLLTPAIRLINKSSSHPDFIRLMGEEIKERVPTLYDLSHYGDLEFCLKNRKDLSIITINDKLTREQDMIDNLLPEERVQAMITRTKEGLQLK